MAEWQRWCQGKLVPPQEAVSQIRSGEKLVLGMAHPPGTLWVIMEALAQRKGELRGVKVVTSAAPPPGPWMSPGMEEAFELGAGFSQRPGRGPDPRAQSRFIPEPWSYRHPNRLLEPGRATPILGADWAAIPVGVPNKNGYISFGHNAWHNLTVARTAKHVIGVAHPTYPWTYGDTIHISELTYVVESVPTPAEYAPPLPPSSEAEAAIDLIGALVSDLIRDGDTLQIGMGNTSMNVVHFLTHKNDLGLHTETMSPAGMLDLVKPGIVNGRRKNINPGKSIFGQCQASLRDPRFQELMDFLDRNPRIEFRDLSYINNPLVIASNDNMVAVNAALAIDLRGQVQLEYAGLVPMAGIAGQMDFVIGSHYSRGGRCLTLIPSTARGGQVSRIVPAFPEGAPVTFPCVLVDYLVTEHGVVNLEGRSLQQRADALISVAHPDFQPELRQAAKKLFGP